MPSFEDFKKALQRRPIPSAWSGELPPLEEMVPWADPVKRGVASPEMMAEQGQRDELMQNAEFQIRKPKGFAKNPIHKRIGVYEVDPKLLEEANTIEGNRAREDMKLDISRKKLKDEAEWARGVTIDEPIEAAVFSDGSLVIMDGHHRTLAAKIRGDKSIPANFRAVNAHPETVEDMSRAFGPPLSLEDYFKKRGGK